MNKESDIVTQMAANVEAAQKQINKYGSVPVFYAPKRRWVRPQKSPGLSHFISQATTKEEIEKLLERGREKFKFASKKTIRRWENEAASRIAELTK